MASVDPSDLLAHAGWLRQLAHSLVREGADDLVQDTWVAALRRPPDHAGSVRPWFRTVLTNAARLRWRTDTNRTSREQAAVDLEEHEAPSPEKLLERHQLQQVLARLVGELDEPFRSTILLRFAEGLTPTQIARRLSIPPGTVRWRLKEALARLRAQLDALHRGDRRAWMLALAPLAMPRPAAATPALPALLLLLLAGVASVVLILAVQNRGGSRSSPPPRTTHKASQAQARPRAPVTAADLSWSAQEGAPARVLRGRVTLSDGTPASRAVVRLIAAPLATREMTSDEQGRFDFGEQAPREYSLGATLPGRLAAIRHVDLRDPGFADVELVLGECGSGLYGKVTDASGTPIQGAQVLREGVVGTETDEGGNYELCALATAALVAELRVVVRADGFGTIVLPMAPVGRTHRDFVLAPEASISGRVVDASGAPVSDARVTISLTAPEASVAPERGVSISTMTESDGAFRLGGLAAGEYTVSASSGSGVASGVNVELEATDTRNIELRMSATGVLRGRVVFQGRPIAAVSVAAGDQVAVSQVDGSFVLARVPVGDVELKTTPYRRTSGSIHIVAGDRNVADVVVEQLGVIRGIVRRRGVPVPYARVDIAGPSGAGVTTDAAGRYEARGLEPGKYGFYCDDRQRGAMVYEDRVFELGLGETREHDIDLAWGAAIAGQVVDGSGAPVPDAMVWFRGEMASACLTDASGLFVCGALRGGTYKASVFPGGGASNPFRFLETPPDVELRDGNARTDGIRLVVAPTRLVIAGKVIDASGAPVPDVAVNAFGFERKPRGNFQAPPGTITDEAGRFRIVDLSPGDYAVEVERGGLATRQVIAAGVNDVSLVLDRPRCDGARGHDVPASLKRPPGAVAWDQSIELVGWSVPAAVKIGEDVEVVVVFRSLKPLDRDWTIFEHFDSSTKRVNGDHAPGIGWCPTKQWKPGETIVDRATVRFDESGRYALEVGFFTGKAPNWENLAISAMPDAMRQPKHTGVHITDVVATE
jgi:RNA polymerase sigma factor (sigma-70 family)